MDAAWRQIGDVLAANRRIRMAQLAARTSLRWHRELGRATRPGRLVLYAPLHGRVVSGGRTVWHLVSHSPVRGATVSTAMRRVSRPGGRLATGLGLEPARPLDRIVDRVNAGGIVTAPDKPVPAALPTPDDLADAIGSTGPPTRWRWLAVLLLVLLAAVLLALPAPAWAFAAVVLAAVVAGAAAVLWYLAVLRRAVTRARIADSIRPAGQLPDSVDALPGSSGFALVTPIRLDRPPPDAPPAPSGRDNPVSTRFKTALRDSYTLVQLGPTAGAPAPAVPLAIPRIADDLHARTDPGVTVPAAVFGDVTLPPRVVAEVGDRLVEAMAYPEFDTPMYEPLRDLSDEAFAPNLHLVEPNSITLLETNQPFIEAYLVGLNHEFARELLWREYPTDQRGSYFRQFWDPRPHLAEGGGTAQTREALKDIPPIHRWSTASGLGEHDNREAGRAQENELVLVIRGELLKKYPNTVISAQPARWQPVSDTDPTPDKAKERRLDESAGVLTPLYEARIRPDIYFFGFDLTAVEARGDDTVDDKPGWFFRIEEVPGDARFGFDLARTGALNVYNDLAWDDVVPGGADGAVVRVADIPRHTLVEPTGEAAEKHPQWEYDRQVPLDDTVSAAELAYIALQVPVLMAVHAAELLPDQD
jgi:hypothetical protein